MEAASGSRMNAWDGVNDVSLNIIVILFIRTFVYLRVDS